MDSLTWIAQPKGSDFLKWKYSVQIISVGGPQSLGQNRDLTNQTTQGIEQKGWRNPPHNEATKTRRFSRNPCFLNWVTTYGTPNLEKRKPYQKTPKSSEIHRKKNHQPLRVVLSTPTNQPLAGKPDESWMKGFASWQTPDQGHQVTSSVCFQISKWRLEVKSNRRNPSVEHENPRTNQQKFYQKPSTTAEPTFLSTCLILPLLKPCQRSDG